MNPDPGRSILSWLIVALFIGAFFLSERSQVTTSEAAAEPQNLIRLESRINQLEQRLYAIEINIRNLEQQVRLSTNAPVATARDTRDAEMVLLRNQVESLRQRVEEITCGLLRLDERTLTAAARESRNKEATEGGEPCRANAGTPLRFSIRQ